MALARALTILILDSLLATMAVASAPRWQALVPRAATTDAQCSVAFSWSNTAKGRSPCLVAADVIAPCHGATWKVPALPDEYQKYNDPKGEEAEPCACSWAAYNLISACAACQGVSQAIRPWAVYTQGCPANTLTNDSYYPSTITLPDDVTIPFWATKNPSEDWRNGIWRIDEARAIADEGRPDVGNPELLVPQKKSSVGAIAGGVIGGVVALGAAAVIIFFLLKNHRKKLAMAKGIVPDDRYPHQHARSPSDMTVQSTVSQSFTNLTSSGYPGHPTGNTPSIRTHVSSNHPFSAFGAPDRFSAQPTVTATMANSPPPPAHGRQLSNGREEIITPFTLHSSNPSVSSDRKVNAPRYDSPTSIPQRSGSIMATRAPQGRLNPPAYTPQDSPSPPPGGSHAGPSNFVKSTAETNVQHVGVSRNNSLQYHQGPDSHSDIMTSIPMDSALSAVPEGTTYTRTDPASEYPRDVKRPLGGDSITGRDLA